MLSAVAISHPVITSGAILVVLAVTLSPYILLVAGAALLLGGSTILPGAIRGLVPKPVQEVRRLWGIFWRHATCTHDISESVS